MPLVLPLAPRRTEAAAQPERYQEHEERLRENAKLSEKKSVGDRPLEILRAEYAQHDAFKMIRISFSRLIINLK